MLEEIFGKLKNCFLIDKKEIIQIDAGIILFKKNIEGKGGF